MGLLAERLAGLIDFASLLVDLCCLRAIDPGKTNRYFSLVVGSDLDGISITDLGDETFDDRLLRVGMVISRDGQQKEEPGQDPD
jgi:hypothetical protein